MRITATAPAILFSFALLAGCGSTPDTPSSASVGPEPEPATASVELEPETVSAQDCEMQRTFVASLAGSWNCKSIWRPRSNLPSRVNSGTVENALNSNGMHVISTFEGSIVMGAPSDGAVSYGYDESGAFVTERTNGVGKSMLRSGGGTFDADSNCLEFVYGSLRETITSNGPDEYVIRMYKTDKESGMEFLTMENVHTRM